MAKAVCQVPDNLPETEQVFTKLKHLQRKTAERPLEATWKRIGLLLNCFLQQRGRPRRSLFD